MIKVVHCKIENYDVYIGRPSIWGNPFSHKDNTKAEFKVNTVEEAVQNYKNWILKQPNLLKLLPTLKDKVLGCWCKTKKSPNALCHGDILKELIEDGIQKDNL